MKILKVTLENVKSYQKETITFHEGINVIAGRNGAGKSTLIEAIGLALFGYMNKDYSYQDFISHGATSGGISIDFAVDGCQYQINRSFTPRGTKGWALHDYSTDETLETHSVEDVNFALLNILGLDGSVSLSELFERIIGVSQGTFTEPFLRSPAGRKEYFERIFMLDNYKTAYAKSSDAAGLLRQQLDNIEKELIMLKTRTETYPELKARYREEAERLHEQTTALTEKQADLSAVKTALNRLKAVKEKINELESKILQLTSEERQFTERLEAVNREITVSAKAKELVLHYANTHASYIARKAEIESLEKKLEIQEELQRERRSLEKETAILSNEIKVKRENLQNSVQSLHLESSARIDELEECYLPLASVEKELKAVSEELSRVEEGEEELILLTQSYQICENNYNQLTEKLAELQKLQAELQNLNDRLVNLPELEREAAELPSTEQALDEVNKLISTLEAQIMGEKDNLERVAGGLCPFMQTECQNIGGENLREYFQSRLQKLEEEKAREVLNKARLALTVKELRAKSERCAVLRMLSGERSEQEKKIIAAKENAIILVQNLYEKVQQIYGILAGLKKFGYPAAAGEFAFTDELKLELGEESKKLKIELAIITNYLELGREEFKSRKKELVSKKEDLTSRRAKFTGQISNIQERRKEIGQKLKELSSEGEMLSSVEASIGLRLKKIEEIDRTLHEAGDSKEELKKAREDLGTLEEGNQLYLQNQQKAEELPILQEESARLTAILGETGAAVCRAQADLQTQKAQFDISALSELEVKAEELNRQVSQAETLIQEADKQAKEISDKLQEMEQIKAQIKEREKEEKKLKKALDLMNFIRNVYNTSAEEIAEIFLQFISHEATNIYRELSSENVQLFWEKDYQIKLKDKHQVRIFKQLSGGEQMSAAFAVRLALLRKFSTVRLGFFDEPTTHLDEHRRLNIAQAIASIREKGDDYFEQIFIISHDDTFTTLTENLVKIDKDEERGSYLISGE